MAADNPVADTWASVLEVVREKVSQRQLAMWFRDLRLLRIDGELFVFGVPNAFLRDWVADYYTDTLRESIHIAIGKHRQVRIEIAPRSDADTDPTPIHPRPGVRDIARPDDARDGGRDDHAADGDSRASGSRTRPREPGTDHRDGPRRSPGRQNRARQGGSRSGGSRQGGYPRQSQSRPKKAGSKRSSLRPVGGELFGHSRYRHFLSDVLLNDDYVFENFVTGPSNHLAHAAAVAVGNAPGEAYNPLFLHGNVGLGKTHLLQAICSKYLAHNPDAKVIYLSCESFVNQFISAVAEGDLQDFRYRYRHVDMLLIDDIHFLAKKERTQEEFFHTFNTLYNSRKQIILSCDSPPREIPTLEDRLVSRFKWGLVAQIEAPDHETRVSIVRNKADRRGILLPDDVTAFIADNITANVRELEGAVLRICSFASLYGREPTLDLAQDALKDLVQPKERKITIETILRVTADHYGVKASEILGKRRQKSISLPRQVAMYLARRLTPYSLVEIGAHIGGRDHTTVIYANDKIARELQRDPRLQEDLEIVLRQIKAGE